MTASESETIIRFDETDRLATIYTPSPRVANMLKRRGLKPDEVTVPPKDKETSWTFKVKKSSIIIKPDKLEIRIGGRVRINPALSNEQAMRKLLMDNPKMSQFASTSQALDWYANRCMELEAQVAQMMDALQNVDDSLENEGVWNDEVFVSWEVKNAIKQARKMALPVRWEAIQKVVEAAKEYMEAHKAWHGEENRFNKMVGLKDALAALEGGGE